MSAAIASALAACKDTFTSILSSKSATRTKEVNSLFHRLLTFISGKVGFDNGDTYSVHSDSASTLAMEVSEQAARLRQYEPLFSILHHKKFELNESTLTHSTGQRPPIFTSSTVKPLLAALAAASPTSAGSQ